MSATRTRRVAIVGYGAIGQVVADAIAQGRIAGVALAALLARSGREAARTRLGPDLALPESLDALSALAPDLVVECAGQDALAAIAEPLLASGIDVMAISTGALARPGLLDACIAAARSGGARLHVPAGAIAGLDGLGAHARAGLDAVTYTSVKPPAAWRGTPAEAILDLDGLAAPKTFFEGSAREAALSYPKNANLAATVALAGLGLDATRVRLVADPSAQGNLGIVEARSAIGTLRVEMGGTASANPKTSASTAYSILHALEGLAAPVVI